MYPAARLLVVTLQSLELPLKAKALVVHDSYNSIRNVSLSKTKPPT